MPKVGPGRRSEVFARPVTGCRSSAAVVGAWTTSSSPATPDPASALPYLLRLPLPRPVVLKARETVFTLPYAKPGFVADLLARMQVRWPTVPVFFAETRPLAEEWTFRLLGAAVSESFGDSRLQERLSDLVAVADLPAAAPTPGQIRASGAQGIAVSARGRVPAPVVAAYQAAQG